MDRDALLDHVGAQTATVDHPFVVGVSGYCGSGKSTLARDLVAAIPDAVRIRGDDFLEPDRSHRRSPDWDGVDRERLVTTVLAPFRAGRPGTFQRYDWAQRALGPAESLPRAAVLVVDLIGLFHPITLPTLDLAVWCDVDLATATRRGIERDRRLGRDHEALWHDVWLPNERDFAERFRPREVADVRVDTAGAPGGAPAH